MGGHTVVTNGVCRGPDPITTGAAVARSGCGVTVVNVSSPERAIGNTKFPGARRTRRVPGGRGRRRVRAVAATVAVIARGHHGLSGGDVLAGSGPVKPGTTARSRVRSGGVGGFQPMAVAGATTRGVRGGVRVAATATATVIARGHHGLSGGDVLAGSGPVKPGTTTRSRGRSGGVGMTATATATAADVGVRVTGTGNA